MSQSLEGSAKTMATSKLLYLRRKFSSLSNDNFEKIRGKGYIPYNILDSFETFDEPFPAYGSSWTINLTGKVDITEEQYEKAKEIYDLMEIKKFGDYHDLYLTLNVYLLADIFEAFREVRLKEYRLDPAHFHSAPNFSWEGMLSTKVELGLLTDIDLLLFCERAIHGGINASGALRHFKANNKYMTNFDSAKPSMYGAFFDVTLYAGTMQQPLPLGK